jgi:mercuric ion transport protein
MNDRSLLGIGIIGTVVAALCCFTPVLAVLLGAVGLSAVVGWLDYVLLPALAAFVVLTVYAVTRRRRSLASSSSVEVRSE